MSGSFESVRWNACVRRLDLGLYSRPDEVLGNGIRTHVNSKGKIPSTRNNFSSEEDRTQDAASSRTASPTHYPLSYSGPSKSVQPNSLILAMRIGTIYDVCVLFYISSNGL